MDSLIVIGIAIIGLIVGAAVSISLLIGMVVVWPLSLILIALGGFTGGGIGAVIGGGISGVVGLFAYNNS